jgi:catechol 2,3-dioxygenase-like lactoylglutathione lyase family enzyme
MLRLKALDHVGIIVTDMDRSLRFYTEGLGMELLRRRGSGHESFAALRVGGTEINVFCNPQSGTVGKEAPQRVDHLCLTVENPSIDDLISDLRAAGISVASGPRQRSDGMALFVHDPDGLRVEFQIKD